METFLLEVDRSFASHSFVGGHYFHGTRAVDPNEFKTAGILPLDAVAPQILSDLRALTPDGNDSFWSKFLVDDRVFPYRSNDANSQGPFGYTVRDVLLNSISLHHWHYTRIPETVHDLIDQYLGATGNDLTMSYFESTRPTIVEYRHSPLVDSEIEAAFWYMYRMVTSRDDGGDFTVGGVQRYGECDHGIGRGPR